MSTTVKELIEKLQTLDPSADVQIIDENSGYVYILTEDAHLTQEDIKYTGEKIAWLVIEEI